MGDKEEALFGWHVEENRAHEAARIPLCWEKITLVCKKSTEMGLASGGLRLWGLFKDGGGQNGHCSERSLPSAHSYGRESLVSSAPAAPCSLFGTGAPRTGALQRGLRLSHWESLMQFALLATCA